MFDLDPVGTVFLIIAVLWLIAAIAYGRDDRWDTSPRTRAAASRTAMTSRSIRCCSTATKTGSAVVGLRQDSHADSYHHGI
jgi:hypothetical protein